MQDVRCLFVLFDTKISLLEKVEGEVEGLKVKRSPLSWVRSLPSPSAFILSAVKDVDFAVFQGGSDGFWEEVRANLGDKEALFLNDYFTTAPPKKAELVGLYLSYGGRENIKNMLLYLRDGSAPPPKPTLQQGLYHPKAPCVFQNVEDYLEWYGNQKPFVGLLFGKYMYENENVDVPDAIISALESEGLGVIPVFTPGVKDEVLRTRSLDEIVEHWFGGRVSVIIKLHGTTISPSLLQSLNVPVFQPIVAYNHTLREWQEDPSGVGSAVAWCVTMPEFGGVIEPIIVGVKDGEHRVAIPERARKIARRVSRWIRLRNKSPEERKIAIILHNNPCAGVELAVGGAANLDALESTARILKSMADAGYRVDELPENGTELIHWIMERKAISEFRWTKVEDIVKHGGALALLSPEEYLPWFSELSPKVLERIESAWGKPPGKGMTLGDKIVITGIHLGNVVVCIQPKRGCYGDRCDGQVCKILHDPDIPPTYQYIATYRWLTEVFGVDCVLHMGTHGSLEFLPGKGVGLSADCYPDIAIGDVPHLYIYNSDNPPEGTIAKRRSYAVLVDHMQTVMVQGGLYGGLEQLEDYIAEYERTISPQRRHALEHMIYDLADKEGMSSNSIQGIKDKLELVKKSFINDGMHIFGEVPSGKRREEFMFAILRYYGVERLEDMYSDRWRDKLEEIEKGLDDTDEIEALLNALDGGFVPPGGSGKVTRGKQNILPTGRNFYSVDPRTLPTYSAYRVGMLLAEKTIERYLDEEGRFPENVGVYWTCMDITSCDGEGMAKIFYLMGVEPVWKGGVVNGFSIIPLSRLSRPRIDVTVRVGGILRDCFPCRLELVDEAIRAVANLDESPEMNFVRKHTLSMMANGLDSESAGTRIFGAKPGVYKAGVNLAVYASAWETSADLADVFVEWNHYAYGKGLGGKPMKTAFVHLLK